MYNKQSILEEKINAEDHSWICVCCNGPATEDNARFFDLRRDKVLCYTCQRDNKA